MPLNLVEKRTILNTIDGRVTVWPKAPLYVHLEKTPHLAHPLNETGQRAWNNGEGIEYHHFSLLGLPFIRIKECQVYH